MKLIIEAEPKEIAALVSEVREPLDMDAIYTYVMGKWATELDRLHAEFIRLNGIDTPSEPQSQS